MDDTFGLSVHQAMLRFKEVYKKDEYNIFFSNLSDYSEIFYRNICIHNNLLLCIYSMFWRASGRLNIDCENCMGKN